MLTDLRWCRDHGRAVKQADAAKLRLDDSAATLASEEAKLAQLDEAAAALPATDAGATDTQHQHEMPIPLSHMCSQDRARRMQFWLGILHYAAAAISMHSLHVMAALPPELI